ncbi:MAG: SCO family protein [Flavobacteriaceae bacterium]|jgi:protein SCO1/2|nr:SCO family protein [Flavobacteriaceae bacterium]
MDFLKKYRKFLGAFAAVSVIILILFYNALTPIPKLPIFQPAMVNFELVDSTIQHQKKYHHIADFSFINQNGKTVTPFDFKGKIYVADFFFTTCPTICIAMTDHLLKVQQKIRNNPNVMLLSHSVTPQIDTVAQLKKYALEKGVVDAKWHLVTGDKKEIYELARKSYLAVKEDGDGGPFDMIHTENFILVDPDRRIRGFYDGTDIEEIKRLLEELEVLIQEYFPS